MNQSEHPHILGNYEHALRELEARFLSFARQIFEKVECAEILVENPDENAVNKLIASSSDMYDEAQSITSASKMILQQYQPFAGDLRTVISIMRATDRVSEINTEIVHIAKALKKLIPEGSVAPPPTLAVIAGMARDELKDALTAFENKDSGLARTIKARDKQLDAQHRSLMEKFIRHISENKYEVNIGLHYIFIVRAIERIGDHAKAIAATSIFQNEGREIRHSGHNAASPANE